jgi:TonB family protein
VGQGSGVPGLKPTKGVAGGTGILQEFLGTDDFPIWYAQQIQDGVTRNWNQLRGGEGRVQVYFRIKKDGKVEAARVEISSGREDLDDFALQAVRRTTLPRLPEEFDGETLGVRFWFIYGNH